MRQPWAWALLLFRISGGAAKKGGKAKLRAMHSMVIKKRGRNATLPLLIKPHVLDSDAAWRAAKKICDGGVPRAARPILVFVHVFKSAGTCVKINQCVSRRWRGGRRDDSARTRRKILISTQVVANINVVVNAEVTIKVCDVIEFDASGRVTSLNAFLKKD